MLTSNKSAFEQKMESLIKRCYIKAYCYLILGCAIALNFMAISVYMFITLVGKAQQPSNLGLSNFSWWLITTALFMSVFALKWTRQKEILAHEERLSWEEIIATYYQKQ